MPVLVRALRRTRALGLGAILAWAGFAAPFARSNEPDDDPAAVVLDAANAEILSLDGTRIRPLSGGARSGGGVQVFVFVSNDCPIANRYAPEIRRIAVRYEKLGVRFWMVHPLGDETPASIREHAAEYSLPGTIVRDPRRSLARVLGITVTPEVAVVDGKGRLRYRGRIDDRFPALGQKRPRATRHDLTEALDAVLSGKTVTESRTRAVGCILPKAE